MPKTIAVDISAAVDCHRQKRLKVCTVYILLFIFLLDGKNLTPNAQLIHRSTLFNTGLHVGHTFPFHASTLLGAE
jgi:hypothetical protein